LPRRRKRVVGWQIFNAHRYSTHCSNEGERNSGITSLHQVSGFLLLSYRHAGQNTELGALCKLHSITHGNVCHNGIEINTTLNHLVLLNFTSLGRLHACKSITTFL